MQTPKRGPHVPLGVVAVNDKWHGTPLGTDIQRQKIGYFIDGKEFGVVDFYISQSTPVVYISQSELTIDTDRYKKRLSKLIDVYPVSSIIVIAERNNVTIDSYNAMVEFATLELELDVIPIGNQSELPQLLYNMALEEAKSPPNRYKQKNKPDLEALQRKMVYQIPGVGNVKIQLLFGKFGHIEGIANASREELSSLVGEATANNVWSFFSENIYIDTS